MQPRKSISYIFDVQNGGWVKKGHRSFSKAFRVYNSEIMLFGLKELF